MDVEVEDVSGNLGISGLVGQIQEDIEQIKPGDKRGGKVDVLND